jgi:hypothetical protein
MGDGFLNILMNNGIGAGCAAAVLLLSWYRETKTIPAMVEAFNQAHLRGVEQLNETQRLLQSSFAERNAKALDTFSVLVREERQVYQKWHEENRDRLDKLMDDLKESRHLTRNLAHQLGLQQAVDADMKRDKPAKQ